MANTQDNIPAVHMRSVDAHFDSLSPRAKAKARSRGFKPYRELPRSGDNVYELDEAKACHRLRQTDGPDATTRGETYTRAQVLAVLAVVLNSIGGKRSPQLRGQTEVIRIGLGIGSKLCVPEIARLMNCTHQSAYEQIERFKRRLQAGLRRVRHE